MQCILFSILYDTLCNTCNHQVCGLNVQCMYCTQSPMLNAYTVLVRAVLCIVMRLCTFRSAKTLN